MAHPRQPSLDVLPSVLCRTRLSYQTLRFLIHCCSVLWARVGVTPLLGLNVWQNSISGSIREGEEAASESKLHLHISALALGYRGNSMDLLLLLSTYLPPASFSKSKDTPLKLPVGLLVLHVSFPALQATLWSVITDDFKGKSVSCIPVPTSVQVFQPFRSY